MFAPRPPTVGVIALVAICCAMILPPAATADWIGDYFPLVMNSGWTYQNVSPPYDTYVESVFEYLLFDGNPAVRVGYSYADHTVAWTNGLVVTVYAEIHGGILFEYDEPLVLGEFSDGSSFEICSGASCETLLIRDWDAIDDAFHGAYDIDPAFDDLIVIASYEADASPNDHNAMLASNLPGGITPPAGAVGNIDWYQRGVGLAATVDVDTETGDVEGAYELIDYVVAVGDDLATPGLLTLAQNFPNPFNPSTSVRFVLSDAATVAVTIHDAAGRLVRTLDGGTRRDAGAHTVRWSGLDDQGRAQPSGTYLCRVRADRVEHAVSLSLIR